MSTIKIHDIVDQEYVRKYFLSHVVPEKFRSNLPDGVYDFQKRDCKWRDVIINGCIIHTISSMWLEQGGPSDLHPSISEVPWGEYLYEKQLTS